MVINSVWVTVDVINAKRFSTDFQYLWNEKNVFLTSDRAYLFKGPPTALLVSLTNREAGLLFTPKGSTSSDPLTKIR